MEIGKIPEAALKRCIFEQIDNQRKEVLLGPGIGLDCGALMLEPEEVFVTSTDPITGASANMAYLAVHMTANDLAAFGAEPVALLVTALLPPGAKEKQLQELFQEFFGECKRLSLDVLGGHSEVTDAVCRPLLSVTGIGKIRRSQIRHPKDVKPDWDIVMSKEIGLEGTAVIAAEKKEELQKRFPDSFMKTAAGCLNDISVVKEGRIGSACGALMHDITEGGIYGALWEIGQSCGLGLEVEIEKIPVRQTTIELCEYFGLNPYQLVSSGSMLMIAPDGNKLMKELAEEGIRGTIIGKMTKNPQRLIYRQKKASNLQTPKSDELYKIYSKNESS